MAWVWLKVFFLAKLFFLIVNAAQSGDVYTIFKVWRNGLALDFSMIGYLTILPVLALTLVNKFPKIAAGFAKYYSLVVFVFVALVVSGDPFFYSYWGQKFNFSFVQFIGKETAGFASINWLDYALAILFFIFLSYRFKDKWQAKFAPPAAASFTGILSVIVLAILMLRGGTGKIPISASNAHFSQNDLYNSAATNAVWNFLAIEMEVNKEESNVFMPDGIARDLWMQLPEANINIDSCISFNDSTNVIVLVMESFVGKMSGEIGGSNPSYMPNLDRLKNDTSIWYSNAYASSFRSDKGLLAITYGVPSFGRQTLTNYSNILARLPNVFSAFNEKGYFTSFHYGGDMDFANIGALFTKADKVASKETISSSTKNAWGIHDEAVFDDFYNQVSRQKQPYFSMMFSLSSHEPFVVPNYTKYKEPYQNSVSYTDSCLGVFLKKIKASKQWENTLILITADHGSTGPDQTSSFEPKTFQIPLIMTGGAVNTKVIVEEPVGQADIPLTLGNLLNSPRIGNLWQHSLLEPNGLAFYSFYNGIGLVTEDCNQQYDIYSKYYLSDTCNKPLEQAYFQMNNKAFFSALSD